MLAVDFTKQRYADRGNRRIYLNLFKAVYYDG
jgi:hypothetical protein